MTSWIIRWNFDKEKYSPGEVALISFWFENTGDTPLYLSEVKLEFDFEEYNLDNIRGMALPRKSTFLGSARIRFPKIVVGRRFFKWKYRMHEYINNSWVDLGIFETNKQYFISIYPTPFYKVFISRGLTIEDRSIGDPIAEMIREWGFETVTIGIEVKVPEEQVPLRVREEIRSADALIAIATPRFMDSLTGVWRTLEWLHNEVGIAFGIDKPLLILKDKRVVLGGLPSYLEKLELVPVIEFDPFNLDELKSKLSAIMPSFRESIEAKRMVEFQEMLMKIAIGGLAVISFAAVISGIAGVIAGLFKK
ncbi:MAG: hypothetical protein QXS32_09140 [Candidatus Nezhaarchaeales archaeon]